MFDTRSLFIENSLKISDVISMLYRTLLGYVNFLIELEHRLIRTIEMEIEIRPNSGKKSSNDDRKKV